jgi:hypothetical protein
MKLFKYLLGMGLCLSIAKATVAQTVRNYNPIIPDLIADPSIVKFGDTFIATPLQMVMIKVWQLQTSSSLAIQRFGELVF